MAIEALSSESGAVSGFPYMEVFILVVLAQNIFELYVNLRQARVLQVHFHIFQINIKFGLEKRLQQTFGRHWYN